MKHQTAKKNTKAMSISKQSYECFLCKKSFVYPKSLSKHTKTCDKWKNVTTLPSEKVTQMKNFRCQKNTNLNNGLNNEKVQSGKRSSTQIQSCKFCTKKFANIEKLQAHEKSHTGKEKLKFNSPALSTTLEYKIHLWHLV